MDWHTLSETGNVLAIVGILVSALGVLVSVLYARSAKRTAKTALLAAAEARREVLIRLATDECKEMIEQAASIPEAVRKGNIRLAEAIAGRLNTVLAAATTSWPEVLKEIQHGEIALALRENQRILKLLRDDALPVEDKLMQVSEMIDLMKKGLSQVYGRLRFRS